MQHPNFSAIANFDDPSVIANFDDLSVCDFNFMRITNLKICKVFDRE